MLPVAPTLRHPLLHVTLLHTHRSPFISQTSPQVIYDTPTAELLFFSSFVVFGSTVTLTNVVTMATSSESNLSMFRVQVLFSRTLYT